MRSTVSYHCLAYFPREKDRYAKSSLLEPEKIFDKVIYINCTPASELRPLLKEEQEILELPLLLSLPV